MLPVDPADYEMRVADATNALDVFVNRLVGDLDQQNGAFTCWVGHSDWKVPTLLADYLIQSIYGVSEALLSASLASKNHRESTNAQDHAFKQAIQTRGNPYPLDSAGRRRDLSITSSAETCFFHIGQALDRLSAAVFIVGGFDVSNVVRVDWGRLEEAAAELHSGSTKPRYQPAGSIGRAVQEALLVPVRDRAQYGPPDWLLWLRETRNGATHRAVATKIVAPASNGRFVRLLYRQPLWSEVQSFVYGAKPPKKAFFDAFILEASEDILDGLVDSTSKLVVAITDSMDSCWSTRVTDPKAIVQPEGQWHAVEPPGAMSTFPGFGAAITVAAQDMKMNPLDAQRWKAARVLDDRRSEWYA